MCTNYLKVTNYALFFQKNTKTTVYPPSIARRSSILTHSLIVIYIQKEGAYNRHPLFLYLVMFTLRS